MKELTIDVAPFDSRCRLYYTSKLQINPGLTVLVGCNGSGKSTLLNCIRYEVPYTMRNNKKITNKDILIIDYDDRGLNGSGGLVSKYAFLNKFDQAASAMCSSEGEKIMQGLCDVAQSIGHRISQRQKLLPEHPFKEIWILFDAVGSGLSIDGILSIKKDLVDVVIEHNKGTDVYFIISTNEYEFANGEDCIDVTTFKHMRFNNYEEYKKFILRTKEKKNKREQKWAGLDK